MSLNLNEIITDVDILWRSYVVRCGYIFAPLTEGNVYDAIVIRNPVNCSYGYSRYGYSVHTLEEHIEFINEHQLKKAIIIAEDLEFVKCCPSLQYIKIIPGIRDNNFDFSPVYDLPEVVNLNCFTCYGDKQQFFSSIDYSQVRGLKTVSISGKGHFNYDKVEMLEELWISGDKKKLCFDGISCSTNLKDVTLMQCAIQSLNGIEKYNTLQSLSLYYNRLINDISMLYGVSESLRQLTIENCPKIKDFSVLQKLTNLEHLHLEGSNTLPNVDFIHRMKKLKTFTCTMNIEDGNLNPCKQVPFARCKNRKHYNLKDKDLPKNVPEIGFELK